MCGTKYGYKRVNYTPLVCVDLSTCSKGVNQSPVCYFTAGADVMKYLDKSYLTLTKLGFCCVGIHVSSKFGKTKIQPFCGIG